MPKSIEEYEEEISALHAQAVALAEYVLRSRARACPFRDDSDEYKVWMEGDSMVKQAQALLEGK